jgi:ribosome-binding protein aMBF1 (putative translation factor)
MRSRPRRTSKRRPKPSRRLHADLAALIRREREAKGLSQGEIGAAIGMPLLQACERCVSKLSPKDRAQLDRILQEMLKAADG